MDYGCRANCISIHTKDAKADTHPKATIQLQTAKHEFKSYNCKRHNTNTKSAIQLRSDCGAMCRLTGWRMWRVKPDQ